MVPSVIAMMVWGKELYDKMIMLHTDNMAVKHAVNKQTSPCPQIMALLRKLVLICLVRNILIKAVHVPTHDNGIANSLSRVQVDRFRKLAPRAQRNTLLQSQMGFGRLSARSTQATGTVTGRGVAPGIPKGSNAFQEIRRDHHLELLWPVPAAQIISFIAYLSIKGRATATISLHVAALSYMHIAI